MSLAADRQSHSQRIGHLLVIEGAGLAFTNIASLAGTDYIGEGRTILPGLECPKSIKHGCNVREGLLSDASVTFTVLDNGHNAAGDVAQMFRAIHDEDTIDRIFEAVPSTESPVTSKLGPDASSISMSGRHLGTEAFSGSGGRRYRYIHPGDAPPPMYHQWAGGEFGGEGLPILEVSDLPIVWEGREIALHELIWDTESESWSNWGDQYDSGSLIFHGTMRGRGEIVATGKFKIECFNEASLCRRVLNRGRSSESFGVVPKLRTIPERAGILVAFGSNELNQVAGSATYDSTYFDDANDLTSISLDTLRTELNDICDAAADSSSVNFNGSGGSFDNTQGGVSFTNNGVNIRYEDSDDPATRFGRAFIVMHQDYWALLGFDPAVQGGLATNSSQFVRFTPFDPTENILGTSPIDKRDGGATVLDYQGYWKCEIRTTFDGQLGEPDHGGNNVTWPAIYPGGQTTLDPLGAQEITLLLDPSVSIPSQLTLPPADLFPADDRPEIDGTPVDSMGWFLLTGKIARGETNDGSQEFEDYAQVVRCSWVASGDGIDYDADGIFSGLRIESYEDPRAFGLPYDRMAAPWLAGGTTEIKATPIGVFGMYRHWLGSSETLPDAAHRIATRLLLGTGTAGPWGSVEPLSYIPVGDNQPTLTNPSSVLGTDVEIADLCLGIDQAEVDFASFEEVSNATLGGSKLGLITAAARGPVKAQDLLGAIMQGRGWCLSWRGLPGETRSRFGCVDFYAIPSASELQYTDPVTAETNYLVITDSDLGGSNWQTSIPKVNQAWRVPIDTFEIESRSDLLDGDTTFSGSFPSTDKGAWRRQGSATMLITDPTLSDPSAYPSADDRNWRQDFMRRFSQTIGSFMALPNRVVTLQVASWKGRYMGPGQAFALTSNMVNSLDGLSIGVTIAPCRVVTQDYNPNTGLHKITAVMYGVDTSSGAGTVWGGMVRGRVTTNPSAGTYTITTEQDWCDAGHGSADTTLAFTDPGFIPDTTDPVADVLESFNGVDWWYAGQGTVTSFGDTSATLDMLNGATLYSDTYKILTLAPTDDQLGWAATIGKVAYVCTGTGTTTGTGETGGKLS